MPDDVADAVEAVIAENGGSSEEAAVVAGREVWRVHAKTLIKVELLGSHIDQLYDQKWLVARDTREPLEVHAIAKTGPQKQETNATRGESGWEFADGRATLAADVVFAPGFRWLRSRGVKEGGEPLAVQMFIPELDNVQPIEVSLAENPDRMLKVMGEEVPVRVFLVAMPALAVQSLIFVHRDSYELVRHEMPAQMFVMERCPAAVIERIQRVDLTGNILAKTNLDVDEPSKFHTGTSERFVGKDSRMRVLLRRSCGEWPPRSPSRRIACGRSTSPRHRRVSRGRRGVFCPSCSRSFGTRSLWIEGRPRHRKRLLWATESWYSSVLPG